MIEIKGKKGDIRAGPTWMRRGMQGHVAAPPRPMRRVCGDVTDAHYLYILI